MTWTLRILPEVADDLRQARDWYERRQPDLGRQFEDDLYATIARVGQSPELHRKMHGEFRRCLLRRFPYAVWFRIEADTIFITLLFHCARNPASLKSNLGLRRESSD
jgi:plasmid stabilization system protein ParE